MRTPVLRLLRGTPCQRLFEGNSLSSDPHPALFQRMLRLPIGHRDLIKAARHPRKAMRSLKRAPPSPSQRARAKPSRALVGDCGIPLLTNDDGKSWRVPAPPAQFYVDDGCVASPCASAREKRRRSADLPAVTSTSPALSGRSGAGGMNPASGSSASRTASTDTP